MHIQAAGGEGLERENGHMSQAESNERLETAKALIADGLSSASSRSERGCCKKTQQLWGGVKENKRNGIPAMFRESADNT